MTHFLGNGDNRYRLVNELGRGGQGVVFLAERESDSKKIAVKWYLKRSASAAQEARIDDLVRRGPPENTEPHAKFIWPIEKVTLHEKDGFGYVMPLIDGNRFFHNNKIIRKRVPAPSLKTLCRLSYNIAFALDEIHSAGLAYCDINLGNVQLDPASGNMVVCDNDNVIPNGNVPEILGMIDFQAPEISKGIAKPGVQSDLYSLAILFYQLWTWEHPMEGALTAKIRSWDEIAKRKFFVDEPLFCHHPTDKRNSALNDPVLRTSVARWQKLCTPRLRELFTLAFTKGVDTPNRRPSSEQWKRAFLEIYQNVSACDSCGREVLFGPVSSSLSCPKCSAPSTSKSVLSISFPGGTSSVAARVGAEIFSGNVEVSAKGHGLSHIIGKIEEHPKRRGMIIRNLDERTWYYRVGKDNFEIAPGQARPLVQGGIILVGGSTITVDRPDG